MVFPRQLNRPKIDFRRIFQYSENKSLGSSSFEILFPFIGLKTI